MEEEVREEIDLPFMSTHVVAFYMHHDPFTGKRLPEGVPSWKVVIYLPGLDGRYNGAFAELIEENIGPGYVKSLPEFIAELEKGLRLAEQLKQQNARGAIRKQIGKSSQIFGDKMYMEPQVELIIEQGRAALRVQAASSTGRYCSIELSESETRKTIGILSGIPDTAKQLLSTLEITQGQ